MKHILDFKEQKTELNEIFSKISDGNSILFLGAGASIGEKKYLSKEIIELYEEYLGKQYNENDVTNFVDILSADPEFNRTHFDNEVENMLRKLKFTEEHKILASLPWRQIITTNYDLLIEQAYDEIKSSSNYEYDIIPIREQKANNYFNSNNEIKYIKLNGCISDKGRYPLAFSSDDFSRLKSFYKTVLNELKNLSSDISLITIGYSFNDQFGKKLLEKFDSYNYRDKKWIINIDPFPNENALHYYSQKRICIIKMSFKDFFYKFKKWETELAERKLKRKQIKITNSRNQHIQFPPQLLLKLDGTIKQLNNQYQNKFIKPIDFYKGEEPNYKTIIKEFDVARTKKINESKEIIKESIKNSQSTLVPLFFVSGEFGIGKTTLTLRLIYELAKDVNLDLVAFEILDFLSLNREALIELFTKVSAKNIVLFCDEVEIDSTFKELIELRRELSIEQFNETNIFFVIPIRENILERYKDRRDIKELYELPIDGKLTDEEIIDLLEKLKNVNLINYRDISGRNQFVNKIRQDYKRDSFVSFLSIVSDGQHQNDLVNAYNELSKIAQKAFLYTALLHRYKLHMPVSLLKQILSVDWEEFIEKIVKIEGKGIFIQEKVKSYGVDSDLYFRTKHPIIADKLVSILIPNKDKQYKHYEKILNSVNIGKRNSYLVTNLLKILVTNSDFSKTKFNKLYDSIYSNLSEDPHFLLNYAINLQKRKTIPELKKALEYLIYAESLLLIRNHKFTHRRAVINFELSKLFFSKEKKELNYTYTYLNEAKELFQIKQVYDPFSTYSYVDYIRLLIWEYQNIQIEDEEELQIRIKIEELFDVAFSSVTENVSWIYSLKSEYSQILKKASDEQEYKKYLYELYDDIRLRPYACVLLYNYYNEFYEGDYCEECISLVDEMSNYTDNDEVVKFLFKYYGQNLHILNNRLSLFKMSQNYPFLIDYYPFRYHYYNFIAESYNRNFYNGKRELANIKHKFYGLNPEFSLTWNNEVGEPQIFDGFIVKKYRKIYKAIKISSLQQTFKLIKGNYKEYEINQKVKVVLHFYLYGIIAELIKPSR
jgi:hypothetical protein